MMNNIANANIVNAQDENQDFVSTPKTPVKIQVWTTDGNIVKADILGEFVKEMDGGLLKTYIKGDSPIDTRVDADKNLHIEIARPAQSYQVDYLITSFDMIYANRDKNITFRPDANTIQSNVSSVITKDYAKFETLIDGKYTIYQINSDNEWSSTALDTAKVLECTPNVTLFTDIAKAEYAYVKDEDGLVYTLREKDDSQIVFDCFDTQTRHQWVVTSDDEWVDVSTPLCDNKLDKNPETINVGNNKLVVASNGQIVLNTSGELVLNSGTLNGNIDQNVLKNLTKYFPEGNPLLLFAQKQANGFYYANNLNYSLIASFFNGWTTSDGSIKTALNHGIVKIKFGQPTYAEIKAAYDNQAALVGYFNGYLYPVGKSLMSGDNKFYYFGLQDRGTGFACSVYAVTESGWTLEKEFLLNNEYNSTDDIQLQQTAYNAYDVKLVAETLEVEEQ